MSIIIKGMEMPKSCWDCFISHSYFDGNEYWPWCESLGEVMYVDETEKHENCPLIEVQHHGRLIDADALRHSMYHQAFETDSPMQKWDSGCWIRYKMFEQMEESAPTIIEAEGGAE